MDCEYSEYSQYGMWWVVPISGPILTRSLVSVCERSPDGLLSVQYIKSSISSRLSITTLAESGRRSHPYPLPFYTCRLDDSETGTQQVERDDDGGDR
jgi:hypothetical protein